MSGKVPYIDLESYFASRRGLAIHQFFVKHGTTPDVIVSSQKVYIKSGRRRVRRWLMGKAKG